MKLNILHEGYDETFRKLMKINIYGDAYNDKELFNLANDVIFDEDRPMSQKIVAYRKMGLAVGEEDKEPTEEDVLQYIQDCKEDGYYDHHKEFGEPQSFHDFDA